MKIFSPVTILSLLFGISCLSLSALSDEDRFSHKAGSHEIILLSDRQGMGDKVILIGATPEMVEKYTDDGRFPNAVNAFLIKSPGRNILVDTGLGTNLLNHLEKEKTPPEKIDVILLTHMHGDHIGGMLREGKPVFPKARIYLSQKEYDYWTSDAERGKLPENRRGGFDLPRKVIAAYKERLHFFTPDEVSSEKQKDVIPDIVGLAAYGHTPGHTMYLVGKEEDRMLIWGDLAHAMAVQMPFPAVSVTYDVDPVEAAKSRTRTLDYVAGKKIPVAGMHIAYPAMGTVTGKDEFQFHPLNKEKK